jgi:DNA-binding transcriptional LysR family regulator
MDTVQNLRAFLSVAETGSFSAAGRRAGLATSVLSKRVDQLEQAVRVQLFNRTTRSVTLTEAGQRWIERVRSLLADIDDTLRQVSAIENELEGPIRIKAPTTLTATHIGGMLTQFQTRHPKVSLDLVLTDRVVNPLDERFDLVIAAFNATFSDVVDIPLCPLNRRLCASPDYLARRDMPRHPRDLLDHHTINFAPTGAVWSFVGPEGPNTVAITPRLSANDGRILVEAAREGNGIALLSEYLTLPYLRSGELTTVLPEYIPQEIWLKMLIASDRLHVARVRAIADYLKALFFPVPPWLSSSEAAILVAGRNGAVDRRGGTG